MKKVLILIAVCASFTASAQELMSKKGTPIRPEVNDYWISIDARPFLEYAGNMFTDSFNSAPSWGFTATNPSVIAGGKVIDANTSYRAKLRLGFGSETNNYAVDNVATPSLTDQTFDEQKIGGTNIAIGLGLQKNRGNGRLRGLYGAEAMIGYASRKTTNSYGNAITAANPTPPTASQVDSSWADGRTTEIKDGSEFSLGINAFVGAEYFFAPKMSLSGEFTWGLGLTSKGEGTETVEGWNGTGVTTVDRAVGKSSTFRFDTGNVGGSINFNFYF